MNRLWSFAAWLPLAAAVTVGPPGAVAALADTSAKLVVGYVASVTPRELVIVLASDGYPGQRQGMSVTFTLTPQTRVLEFERPATVGSIVARREVTVAYDEAKDGNVAREVRVLDMLPAGVAMPGLPTAPGAPAARAPEAPDRRPPEGVTRAESWRTSYDAFVAELQAAAQSQGLSNPALAARFGGQRVTWNGEVKGLVAQEGQGVFLEIGFPQRRLRLRDGSTAFNGFAVNTAGTHIKTTDSKAVAAIRIPASVLPTGVTTNVPDVVRVSFVLTRVWIQPPDPRANPKLGTSSVLAIATQSAQLVTTLAPKSPAGR
jgi:hypothetical protein